MSSFLQDVQTQTRERVSLPAGSYGTSKEPGLKILMYSEKGSKFDKTGAMQHSFLVAATRPSKEMAAAAKAASGGNGAGGGTTATTAGFVDEPDFEGTAFLKVVLHELWLNPEATALAFTEASRNKEGVIQADYVAKAIESGETDQESIEKARAHFRQVATDKVIAANTPAEQMEEAVEDQYQNELTQISIKVGQFVDLLDWVGVPRDLHFDPIKLVGAEFSGKIEHREWQGKTRAEVKTVYGRSKK
jgi:hypothetical protein